MFLPSCKILILVELQSCGCGPAPDPLEAGVRFCNPVEIIMICGKGALDYHSQGRRGITEATPSKPSQTQCNLSLAYTPSVAEPCLQREACPADAYRYPSVAVIFSDTAPGFGDIGALKGKGALFK